MLGVGSGANVFQPAELVLAFSNSGLGDDDFDNWDSETLEFEIGMNNNLEFDIPSETKHIMIIAKEDFGGWNIGLSSIADIYAIRLFTDKKTVGLDESVGDKLGLSIRERMVNCDEYVTIEVYSITGVKLQEQQNTKELDLSNLDKGAYFVKAISIQTGEEELLNVLFR